AVNGAAVGMGAEYTLQCDFRLAADTARFGFIFSRRGIISDTGAGTYLLPQVVGLSKALELLYSGDVIDAEEALKIGLVNKVVPLDQLEEATMAFARRMMEGAPLSAKWSKELTYRGLERDTATHLAETRRILDASTKTEDHVEGIRSFVEKRKPQWKGR
ncbi:MAG: enoyl-CoA hydratase-related protein, partial [Dehalococcoidia bacterium]|nr:enoyl-CoA hydratase-related protein [Dehalococcoidia bacterium]